MAVTKKDFYRFIKLALLLAILVSGIWGWQVLHDPKIFPINRVDIKASYKHLNADTIQQQIAPYTMASFFGFNVSKVKQALLSLPWVYKVTISRRWPDTIIVKVHEQTAMAKWNDSSLLNSQGEIFTPKSDNFSSRVLPQLLGPDSDVAEVWHYYQIFVPLLKRVGRQVVQLQFAADQGWRLVLDDDIRLVLGKTDIESRLQRFVSAYDKIIADHSDRVMAVDLRYTDGFAVKWKPKA